MTQGEFPAPARGVFGPDNPNFRALGLLEQPSFGLLFFFLKNYGGLRHLFQNRGV
jgi:hypothetical protein